MTGSEFRSVDLVIETSGRRRANLEVTLIAVLVRQKMNDVGLVPVCHLEMYLARIEILKGVAIIDCLDERLFRSKPALPPQSRTRYARPRGGLAGSGVSCRSERA